MPSRCQDGHAAKSMPAPSHSPRLFLRGVMMGESDDNPFISPTAKGRQKTGAKIPSPARVAAFQTGISAESRACIYLIAKGYRILARRFRTPYGEIDVVARRRGLLAFVEVKARANLDDAAYSVTPQQQQRIVTAAQAW